MSDVPIARPIGPDDAGVDHFVFVCPVIYSFGPPYIDVMHANFFACHTVESENDYPRWRLAPHRKLPVFKNVYNLHPVFVRNVVLVVSSPVRELLATRCTAEFREVAIERAFWFPYGPGDKSYEVAGVNTEGSTSDVMTRFAKVYACPAPAEMYHELVTPTNYLHGQHCTDMRTLQVGIDAPGKTSVHCRDVSVSPSMIREHGVVLDEGYLLRPDVYDLLNPYLHRPWFWAQRYAYE